MKNQSVASGFIHVGEDTELYYEEAGSGPAVIFVHAHSVDHRMWDAQFAQMAAQYRVIRYDLRGYGKSGMPMEGKDYLHAEDLWKLTQHLHVEKAHIVGLSLGSFVALDFMNLYPENTLSVSISAGAIYTNDGEGAEEDRAQTLPSCEFDNWAPEQDDPVIIAKKEEWFKTLMECTGANKEAIRESLWKMVNDWSAWTFRFKEPRCLLGQKLTKSLYSHTPSTPILVIIGGQDSVGSIRSSEKLLGIVPHARRVNISDAGHFSNMERPQEFSSALVNFFESL